MKQKKLKWILSFLLVLCMAFGLQTNIASAQDGDNILSGTCGAEGNESNVTWKLEQNNQDSSNPTYTLTILGAGAMKDYGTSISMPWNNYKTSITYVQIEDGITRIGDRAFMGCSNVREINISDSVTEYGTNCFHSCTSLTSLNIGKNVSSIGQIGICLDTRMTNLTVDSGNENYAVVNNLLYKLNNNATASLWQTPAGVVKDLTHIQIPENITWNGKTYTVTSIGSAESGGYTLSGAENVESVTFSKNIKEIGISAFNDCKKLQTIDLESIDVLGGGAFNGCTSLTNIKLSDNLVNLPNSIFQKCSALTEISIPENVTEIGRYAFSNTSLTELDIPTKVKNIGDFAFSNCKQLKSVTGGAGLENLITTTGTAGQTNKGYVFGSCSSLETVDLIGTIDLTIPANTFGNNANDCAPIKNFTLENGTFSQGFVFFSNTLENLKLGKGVEDIPNDICKNQTSLKSVEIIGVKTIGSNAFNGCNALESVKFGNDLTSLGANSFANTTLKNISLPASVKTIGNYAFDHCEKLEVFSTKSNALTIGSAAFNANMNMIALDLSAVKSLTLSGNHPIAINRTDAKKIVCYVSSQEIQSILSNQFSNDTVYFAVTNDGTFADNTGFTENTLSVPTKANYKFLGWYTKDGTDDDWGEQITDNSTLISNTTYYAKWEAKTVTTITINTNKDLSKTYDGKAVSLSDSDCEINGGTNRTVTFSYQINENDKWKDIDSAPTNVGEYRVKAVVAENEDYASAESDYKVFTISKAEPNYTAPTDLTAIVGQTLGDVKLPDGFTWQDVDTTSVGIAGTHTFKVTYTPEDTDNYNIVKDIEVKLTVNPKMETLNAVPTITAEDQTLRVGDIFKPLDGVMASDKEDGDITKNIEVIKNTVDTSKAGTYEVTYKVTDSQGASVIKTVMVTVKENDVKNPTIDDNKKPTITVTDTNKEPTNTDKTTSTHPQTGDNTNMMLWSALVILSGGLLTISAEIKRKRKLEK